MRDRISLCLGAAAFVASALVSASARADVSAWLQASAGQTTWRHRSQDFRVDGTISIDAGVGSSPKGVVVIGGLARVIPYTGSSMGADVALLARGATRGFMTGPFGVALDAGVYGRAWGVGSAGFAGGVTLGGPLGLSLSATIFAGSGDTIAIGSVLGVDFARLLLFRDQLRERWPNPRPADRQVARARGAGALGLLAW